MLINTGSVGVVRHGMYDIGTVQHYYSTLARARLYSFVFFYCWWLTSVTAKLYYFSTKCGADEVSKTLYLADL